MELVIDIGNTRVKAALVYQQWHSQSASPMKRLVTDLYDDVKRFKIRCDNCEFRQEVNMPSRSVDRWESCGANHLARPQDSFAVNERLSYA